MKIHRWLDFKVTHRCNNAGQKCDYCAVPVGVPDEPEHLSINTIHRTLLDALRVGFDIFWFLGGEPSLRDDIDTLFDPIADDGDISLTVVTNGRQENWKMAEGLFRTRARRACVQVSFDTLNRPNPKHADPGQVTKYISSLSEMARDFSTDNHYCCVEIHCVVSRVNLSDFDAFVQLMASRNVPVSLAIVCPWRVVDEPTALNEFTREELLDVAHRIDLLSTGLPTDRFNPIVAQFIRRILDGPVMQRPCGAGLTHLVINANGAVHRCMAESFRPESALGNVCEQRLHHILRSVSGPALCDEGTECFDGFAWDQIAIGESHVVFE